MAGIATAPAVARAADETLAPYAVEATPSQLADLKSDGYDIEEGGAAGENGVQRIELAATPSQVKALKAEGLEPEALALDPVTPKSKAKSVGASPNPYFSVYRSYMEKGGIADEMKAIAAANPDVMK